MSNPKARATGESFRDQGKRIVFTNGCFDILHEGHTKLLREAKSHGDVLVVGLNNDDSVKRLKGPERPINSEDQRQEVLEAVDCVDAVFLFAQDTPLELILDLKPDILVKGSDYEKSEIVGASEVESWGGSIVRIELVPGVSTTAILEERNKQ